MVPDGEIVARERESVRQIRIGSVASDSVVKVVAAIASQQREVRPAHLEVHPRAVEILSSEQTERYEAQWGYRRRGANHGDDDAENPGREE